MWGVNPAQDFGFAVILAVIVGLIILAAFLRRK